MPIYYDTIIGVVDESLPYQMLEGNLCTFNTAADAENWGRVVAEEGHPTSFYAMFNGNCVDIAATVKALSNAYSDHAEETKWIKAKPINQQYELYTEFNPYNYRGEYIYIYDDLKEAKKNAIQECEDAHEDIAVYGLVKIGEYEAPTIPVWYECEA